MRAYGFISGMASTSKRWRWMACLERDQGRAGLFGAHLEHAHLEVALGQVALEIGDKQGCRAPSAWRQG